MQYFFIFLRGLAMGAADVVPGVSGGTIAFITGIYQRLLNAIKGIRPSLLKLLFKEGFSAFWKAADGNFLVSLALGIALSIVSLARAISLAMASYPQLLWSFFAGLILASVWYLARSITGWTAGRVGLLLLGALLAFGITSLPMGQTSTEYWMVFLSGSIAICAMILPGISGSFILLLLGMYSHVLEAIHSRDLPFLAIFAGGCLVGLLSFSHILSWTFKRFHQGTMAVLTGFMLGSLPKVWPWQNVVETRINSKGEEVPLLYDFVLPGQYAGEPMLLICLLLFVVGFAFVLLLEAKSGKEQDSAAAA